MEDQPGPQLGLYILNLLDSPVVEITGKVLILLILLFISAFLTAYQTALESFFGNKNENKDNKSQIEKLPQTKSTLTIIQFLLKTGAGITIAEIIRQSFNITNNHVYNAIMLCFIFIMVVYGQWVVVLAPKNKNFQDNFFLGSFISFLNKVLLPLSKPLSKLKKFSKVKLQKKGFIQQENKEGKSKYETNLAKVAESFNQTTVRQVMRSRLDITAFNIELDFHDLLENLNKFGFSRVPVYRDTIDKIEGILYIKDLLPYIGRNEQFPWQNLLRPAYFVPENKKIEELLREFQEKHAHMALIVDGYGGISGLITLEDILEEIVGEINDELDEIDLNYIQLDDNSYIFEGKTSIHDFSRVLDIENTVFEEVKGESESLGGVLLQINSDLPKKGDKIFFKNFVFRIDSANNKRIKKVKVEVQQEKEVNENANF